MGQTVIATFRCPTDISFPDGRLRGGYNSECWPDNEWWISVGGAITNYKASVRHNWGWGDYVVGPAGSTDPYAFDGLDDQRHHLPQLGPAQSQAP